MDGSGFGEREIKIRKAGAGEGIAAQVADGTGGGREEGCGVEELIRARGGGSVSVERALEVRVHVGTYGVARIAGAGGVIAELRRERKAGLQVGDGGECPAGNGGVGRRAEARTYAMAAAEGQIVTAIE